MLTQTSESLDFADVREANRNLNIAEFQQAATVLRSKPRVLFIELTENCNLSCPMCRSNGPFDRSKNMSLELFDKVAEELFPTAEIVDLRGWGESTILKNFPDFVEKTLAYGCRVRLVTNLTVPNENLWRRLVRANSLIAVSFDAAEEETLAILRRGAKLSVILRNLEILADESEKSGISKENIHLNVVVQPRAFKELHKIVRIAGDLGFRVHINPVSLDSDDPDNLKHHRTALAEAIRETAQAAEETGVEVRIDASLDEMWADPSHAAKMCTHPWMYCYVNYRGKIGFCDHLIGEPGQEYLLGDFTTASFEETWNGEQYRRLRSEHANWQQGISFEECNWCYRNRYVDFDEQSYPPYAQHIVPLTTASCSSFVGPDEARPESKRRLQLPIIATHGPGQ